MNQQILKIKSRKHLENIPWDDSIIEQKEEMLFKKFEKSEYSRIFEQSSDALLIIELKSKKLKFANKKALELIGYDENELLDSNISNIFPKIELPRILKIFNKIAKQKIDVALDIPMQKINSEKIFVNVSGIQLKIDGKNYLAIFLKDITNKKRFEIREINEIKRKELEKERDKLLSMFEAMGDVVYTISNDFKIEYMNKAAIKEFGNRVGEYCYKVFHDSKRICKHCDMEETLKGKTIKREWKPFNSNKVYEAIITPIKNSNGAISRLEIDRNITEKNKLKKEIKKTKEYLEKIIQSSPDAIISTDMHGRITLFSKGAEKMFGYSEKEVIGEKIENFYLKGKKEPIKIMKMLKKNEIIQNYESVFVAKDKRLIPVSISISYLRNDKGEVIGTLGIGKDITKRKMIEGALKESEEHFCSIVENSPSGIGIINENFKITYVNDKIVKILGYPKEEIIGQDFRKFIAKESIPLVQENYIKRHRGEKVSSEYEFKIIRKDGEIRDVEIKAMIMRNSKGKKRTIAQLLDITEKKRALESLKESEERYRDLFENANDIIQSVDINGKFKYVNKKWLEVLEYKKEEVENLTLWDILRNDQLSYCKEIFNKVLNGEAVDRVETVFVSKNGKEIYVEGNVNSQFKDGKFVATRGIFRDITFRKEREEEIIALNDYNEEILQSVKSGIVATDKELKVLTWNDYMEESYGLKKEKIIGKNLLKALPQLKKDKFDKIFRNVLKEGKTFKEYMVEHRTKRGIRFYNLTFAPRKNRSNNIVGILMNWDDVTELAKLGAKLSTIYNLSKEMILSKDENQILEIGLGAIENVLKFQYCSIHFVDKEKNELYVRAYKGYSKDIDKLRFSIEQERGIVCLAFKKGKVINIGDVRKEPKYILFNPKIKSEIAVPLKIRDKTIGVINVESNKLNAFDESDEELLTTLASSISTALNNISLHKETEKRANSLAFLNNIAKAISSTFELNEVFKIFYMEIGKILDTKNLYVALFDKKKNKLNFGLEVEDNKILSKRKRNTNHGLTEYVIRNKKPLLIKKDFEKVCKKLEIKHFGKPAKSWLGVPLIAKGEAIGAITIQSYENENAYDEEHLEVISIIADQLAIAIENSRLYKDLERQHYKLKEAYEELEELDKIKSDFLAVTSHEFGTPITILKGNVNMLLEGTLGEISEIQRKRLESINNSIERLIKMRNQTILLSKLDSKALKLIHDNVKLNELIEELVNEIRVVADKNKQKIITNLEELNIICDKETIRRVFENLLSNAVKYSGENSVIKIEMNEKKNKVHIIVSDNGVGIGKEHLDKLFDRFYIAHKYLSHKEGTGLGLAIVKEIVEAHGGKVWCESKLNKGTKFHVILPKKPKEQSKDKKINEFGQEVIKKNEAEILENLDTGIVVTDNNLKILFWNNYMAEHYGGGKGVIGKKILKCFPKMKKEGFDKIFEKVLKGKEFKEYMVKHETKKGIKVFNIFISPRKNSYGRIIGILMRWEDVTDLANLGKRLSVLYDLTHKMVLLNTQDEVLDMSINALKDILKFKNCSIILKDKKNSCIKITKGRGMQIARKEIRYVKGIANSVLKNGRTQVISKCRGENKNFEIAVPIKIREKIIGVISVKSKNINEFDDSCKKLLSILASEIATSLDNIRMYQEVEKKNKEIKKAYEELKELDDMKSEFIAVTAHEIGTPLTIIKGNVEMLRDGNFGKINEIQKKRLTIINNNIERINLLSKDSLILSKIDSNKLKLIKENLSLSKLTKEIVEEMKSLAEKKNQKIEILENGECNAFFDISTITQVISNLLSNAIKYTPKNGKIRISLENGRDEIHFRIEDNGIGIPKKEQKKIFERFYMVESHLHHKEGSGLGLAIVKEIIELHKGKVWVESKEKKGTTFHFKLPRK